MINLINYKGTRGRRESMRAKNEQAPGGIVTKESVHVHCNLCNRKVIQYPYSAFANIG